jgi:twitching motility protein PilJ
MTDKMSRIHLLMPLTIVAIVGVLIAMAAVYFLRPSVSAGVDMGGVAGISQNIALNSAAAVTGDQAAFDALKTERQRLNDWLRVHARDLPDQAASQRLMSSSQQILDSRDAVVAAHEAARSAASGVPQLLQGMGNIVSGFGATRVEGLAKQLEAFELTGRRLSADLGAIADGIGDAGPAAQRASDAVEYLGQVLGELGGEEAGIGWPKITNADAEQKLKTLTAQYRKLADDARAGLSVADKSAAAHRAAREALAAHQALLPALRPQGSSATPAPLPIVSLAILGVVLLLLLGVLTLAKTAQGVNREARKHSEQNDRNQQAILRLLDELSNLADGDLTVQATVTEDITGAIADSINYAIEALRELVTTINGTAITLDAAAKQTLASAGHLAKASVTQSKQVASASESAAAMANSVEEVSGNAERSSDVARHAVDIAHKGGDAVRRTIDGMNTIRETIQETSKRIKRLGESSQEIGNIVELINDIAEQTNILALNASIQASMAGEAGRGFAVVADEVQRLAERAANATKQIEVLVRTIQADTNEAVVSMERSTTDVVGGARLAENAGAALEEIEQVSNQIASLVQNISASSRQQTSAAQDIARNMQVLREISAQTAENSSATTNSIGKLAQLSAQLRKSVAGFRLPDVVVQAAQALRDAGRDATKAPQAPAAKPAQPQAAGEPKKAGRLSA